MERQGPGEDKTRPETIQLATVDAYDPLRNNIFDDEIIAKISRAWNKKPELNELKGSRYWSFDFNQRLGFNFITLHAYHADDKNSVLFRPAHDELSINKQAYRGKKENRTYINSGARMDGITSVEQTGDTISFVQNNKAWDLRISVRRSGLVTTSITETGQADDDTAGMFTYSLQPSGHTGFVFSVPPKNS